VRVRRPEFGGRKNLLGAGENLLGDIEMRKRHKFWFPLDGVGDTFRFCGPDIRAVTAVVLECWSKVPCVDGMWGPLCSDIGFLVYEDVWSGWGNGRCIVGILAKHLDMCGKFWG
jgi:hypothetical protein